MIDNKSEKASSDRLHRFVSSKKSSNQESITCGEFIKMFISNEVCICQVLGFRYLTGKGAFKGVMCPIKPPEKARGVEILINILKIDSLTKEVIFSNNIPKYVNIQNYKAHIKLQRSAVTNKMILIE